MTNEYGQWSDMPVVQFPPLPRPPRLIGIIPAFVLAAALVLFAAPATAEVAAQKAAPATAPITWRMTTEYPRYNISGIGIVTFARLVSERTGGVVTVAPAFDNELKITSAEMPRAMREGRIEAGDAFAGPLSGLDPIFGLSTLPFMVQSIEAARALNSRARPLYEKALGEQGLKLLYLTIWPASGLWTEHALGNGEDLATLSLRTYDEGSTGVMRAAGANAEFLPMDKALAALKEHRLNAFLTSGDGGSGRKLWDFLPHFTAINYAMPVSIAFVRSETFAALSAEMQQNVLAAASETEQGQLDLLAHRTAENYARMRANGVTIVEPAPAALLAALRQAAERPIADWRARAGHDAAEIADWAIQQ
jgi:TRAP-type C4-dicarboxylate transport system substrate-binding protein